jgi:hypothetical protein
MNEIAWLIEIDGPKWCCFVNGKSDWTADPNQALRFARKVDADNFKAYWCVTAKSTEHAWVECSELSNRNNDTKEV